MKRIALSTLTILITLFLFTQCSKEYDIVIQGGTIYEGTYKLPYIADIGIINDKIVDIGKIKTGDARIIDASRLIVAPGFIDIHTHCDGAFNNPDLLAAENYLTQGVTTVVTGNCGDGTYRVKETFAKLDSSGFGPNVIHLVGHNTIRKAVMGMEDRAPTEEEMQKMKSLAARAMKGGAAGLSSGLFYAPGSYAKTEEVIEIAKTVSEYGGIYTSHLRDESDYSIGLINALKEAINVGEVSGLPVQISHIKALGKPVWGLSDKVCGIIEEARERGIKVMADQYPYPASSTSLAAAVIPRWVQAEGAIKENLSNKKLLPGIIEEISYNIERRGGPESLVVVSFSQNIAYSGKNLEEISQMLELPVEETVVYLCLMGSPSIISFNMDEYDVNNFMKKDYVMTCSDGHVPISKDKKVHPRSYGAFTRKIRKYVIDDELISMEHAIRAATSLPASMLGLTDRGMIKKGYIADIVIFDPENISDKASFEDPQQYSSGLPYLIVNGKIVIENSIFTGYLAGKPLRLNNY